MSFNKIKFQVQSTQHSKREPVSIIHITFSLIVFIKGIFNMILLKCLLKPAWEIPLQIGHKQDSLVTYKFTQITLSI